MNWLYAQLNPVKTLRIAVRDRAIIRWLIWGALIGAILL